MVLQDDVTRLFAADVEAALAHPLHDVAIADLGALQRQPLGLQAALQSQVGHDGGDEALAVQPSAFGPVQTDQSHDLVAVDHMALLVADDHPVRVAVQGDADVAAIALDRFRHGLGMGRAALSVDVQAVRLHPDGEDLGAQLVQGRRRHAVARAVGAVDGDAQALEAEPLGEGLFGDFDIAGRRVVDPLDPAQLVRGRQVLIQGLVHHGFDLQLDLVRQLVAVRPEQLDAVVGVVVVRGRDHDAQIGAHRAGHHRHARRRQGAEGAHVHADAGQARHQRRLDHIAGQARVLADHHQMATVVVGAEQPPGGQADAQGHLGRHRMGVGPAANAIGAEVFSLAQKAVLRWRPRSLQRNLPKPIF